MMTKQKKLFGALLSPAVRQAIEVESARNGRSLSAVAEALLATALRQRGHDLPDEALARLAIRRRSRRELEMA